VSVTRSGHEAQAPLRATLALARPVAGRLAAATALGAGAVAAGVGLMATSAFLISRASTHPPVLSLEVAVTAVQFFALSRGILRYFERLVGHDAAFGLLADTRVRVYDRLTLLAPTGLPAFRRGDLLARLVDDVDVLQDLMLRVVPPYAIAAVVGTATALFVGWLLPAAGVVLAVGLAAAATAVPAVTGLASARAETAAATLRGDVATTTVDLLEGLEDLVLAGADGAALARAGAADAALARARRSSAAAVGAGSGIQVALAGLSVVGCLAVGASGVRAGHLDPLLLAVVTLTPLAAFEAVVTLPAAAQAMERVRRSATRVFAVLDTAPPVVDPATPAPLPDGPGQLRTDQLSVAWPGAAVPALREVDLRVDPGCRVAVVGPSGAGKSTLLAALLSFLPPASGRVLLDGVDTATLAGDDVRTVVGLAAQDAHVFATTLADNLRLARPQASDEELVAVLARVRLGGWLADLPAGLATPTGPDGAAMSGGQRQRLGVARALLADFAVLALDEPGEHLDAATADALTADVLAATVHHATVVVSHRLTGLDGVDEVLVVADGAVVERGSPADLAAAGGYYARMAAQERDDDVAAALRAGPAR